MRGERTRLKQNLLSVFRSILAGLDRTLRAFVVSFMVVPKLLLATTIRMRSERWSSKLEDSMPSWMLQMAQRGVKSAIALGFRGGHGLLPDLNNPKALEGIPEDR